MTMLGTFTQQPADVLDYVVNAAPWLNDRGDTIAHITHAVTPSSGTVSAPTHSAGLISAFFSGPASGVAYKVSLTVHTTGGRVKQIEFMVLVREI